MLRQDPLTGRWVIIATGRKARPNEYPIQGRQSAPSGRCPFCPGHENDTTPEILALGRPAPDIPNGPGWRLRVFPNMYPAVTVDPGNDVHAGASRPDGGLYPGCPGGGLHEVIAYSPEHEASLASLDPAELAVVLKVVCERAAAIALNPQVRFVAPFCNHGPEAGATLSHPHLQIIGTSRIPLLAVEKCQRLNAWRRARGECLLCALAASERQCPDRLISADDHWTVLAPWASRFPWEILLIPARHAPSAAEATMAELDALAACLSSALRRLQRIHGDLSLNLILHLAPQPGGDGSFAETELDALGEHVAHDWHWHIEVLPRLNRLAGFEAGTGYAINAVEPEEAARRLRGQGCQP